MKRVLHRVTVVGVAAVLVGCGAQHTASLAAGGPELFGAGLFSTGAWDFFMPFSPDQRLVLFCRANDDFSAYDNYETHRDLGRIATRASSS